MLAGLIEMSVGALIRPWIGNKESPIALGIITFFLSLLAFLSVDSAHKRNDPTNNRKIATLFGVLVPATICFTTVGRLWYLPGLLLIVTSSLLVYKFWFAGTNTVSSGQIIRKLEANQKITLSGCMITLISMGLSFPFSDFGLFDYEAITDYGTLRAEVTPMDMLRVSQITTDNISTTEIEILFVMIVYILIILGTIVSLISNLVNSRFIVLTGCVLSFSGLILFLFCLPSIIARVSLIMDNYLGLYKSLGLGWYLIFFGTCLSVIGIFIQPNQSKLSANSGQKHCY